MIGHLDCSTGVSGDKFLGALLDVGRRTSTFGADMLRELVSSVAPEGRVDVQEVRSHGIAAISVRIETEAEAPHRTWADVRSLLAHAPLAHATRERALKTFELLAESEARAHGIDPEAVHFHELGALDSILDVIGVCAGLDAIGVDRLTASPVATGWGTVGCAHGVLPVPAPATGFLLEGIPTVPGHVSPDGAEPGELTTPTGAALLRACVEDFGFAAPMTPAASGFGAGTRDIGIANVCRLMVGDPAPTAVALHEETIVLLETNIDHISAEASALAADELLAEGALDVWIAPIVMKKGRPAFTLSVLATADTAQRFAERTVALTGTLGVRRRSLERFVADRQTRPVATPFGSVRVKIGADRMRPEADDVARIAREMGVSFDAAATELGAFLAQEPVDP